MVHIIREVSKLLMFAITWTFPLLLSRWNENNEFLWFFILSLIITVGIFSHYEDLEEIDNEIYNGIYNEDDDDDE